MFARCCTSVRGIRLCTTCVHRRCDHCRTLANLRDDTDSDDEAYPGITAGPYVSPQVATPVPVQPLPGFPVRAEPLRFDNVEPEHINDPALLIPLSPPPVRNVEFNNTITIVKKEKYTVSELRTLMERLQTTLNAAPYSVDVFKVQFEEPPPKEDPTSCAICMEDFEINKSIIVKLPCDHWYDAQCLNKHNLAMANRD